MTAEGKRTLTGHHTILMGSTDDNLISSEALAEGHFIIISPSNGASIARPSPFDRLLLYFALSEDEVGQLNSDLVAVPLFNFD